jgi:hypothetical protein
MQTTDRTRNLESAPSVLQYSSTGEYADTSRAKSGDFSFMTSTSFVVALFVFANFTKIFRID